jgi:hypothetical protein
VQKPQFLLVRSGCVAPLKCAQPTFPSGRIDWTRGDHLHRPAKDALESGTIVRTKIFQLKKNVGIINEKATSDEVNIRSEDYHDIIDKCV